MCQVLYVSYLPILPIDLSRLTVSIHKLRKLGIRGHGHFVKVTELVIGRMRLVFPNCLGGCVFTSYPYSFFSDRGKYSEKEWANPDLISSTAIH